MGGSNIDELFQGELHSTMECAESKEEPTTETREPFTKLQCFIDENTTHLVTGMKNKMSDSLEKHAPTLGRNAVFKTESRVSKLPKILTIQIMRFFWKQKVQKSAKIKKAVVSPNKLDVYELCAPELKSKIGAYRRKKLGLDDEKKEEKKDDAMNVDEPSAPKPEEKAEKMEVDEKKESDLIGDILKEVLDGLQMDADARVVIEEQTRDHFEKAAGLVKEVVEAYVMTTFGVERKPAEEKKEELSDEQTGY